MTKGITTEQGTPRTLEIEGVEVAHGGSSNSAGLYAVGSELYLDGEKIADSQNTIGLHVNDGTLYFGDAEVGSESGGGGDDPVVASGLWAPPAQGPTGYNDYQYIDIIDAYDDLMDNSNYPGTVTKFEYSEVKNGTRMEGSHEVPNYQHSFVAAQSGEYNENGSGFNNYPLYHYVFTPRDYTKTFYLQAGIHGNEKDAPQRLLRIMDIICNHANETAYSRLAALRDNVRFIVVPVVSPSGFDHASMNLPFTDWNGKTTYIDDYGNENPLYVNMNRNYDVIHQYTLASVGTGGNYPWQFAEIRHIKSIIDNVGPQNIDYSVDYHDSDTPDVRVHFWFNFNADGPNRDMCLQLLNDNISYEEELIANGGRDYRDFNNPKADERGWVHTNTANATGTGTGVMWYNFTMGMFGSTCEYIAGYWGYPTGGGTFTSEMVTRSLRMRANLLIYAYEMLETKGWRVNEAQDAEYFHFDYPISMTRQGLRKDFVDTTTSNTVTTIQQVYSRWDELTTKYPSYVTKSATLGTNSNGVSIYSYTLGSGNKKVLFIGGTMRWGNDTHKETEFGMYVLAEYLCNDYVVDQSKFLTKLKQDYTIVVIPCIDIYKGDNAAGVRERGLNTTGLSTYAKWQVGGNGKCVAKGTHADSSIFMSWISTNSDAIALLSGGEDTSGYANEFKGNTQASGKYSTDYMTQIILPKNQTAPQWLSNYCDHLENDRGENTPVVEYTGGTTCGDYAYDQYGIPAYFINLKLSQMWAARQQYMQSTELSGDYFYRTYETGRRIANIANFFLMAGGDV